MTNPGSTELDTTIVCTGAQSLSLPMSDPGALASFTYAFATQPNPEHSEAWIRPTVTSPASPEACLNLNGSCIGFFLGDGMGEVHVFDYNGLTSSGVWRPTGERYPLGSGGLSAAWIRVNVRQDTANGTWDIAVGGVPRGYDLGVFAAEQQLPSGKFQVFGNSYGDVYLDDLSFNPSNLLGTDADKDGILDAWELQHGLSTTASNRTTDTDNDGLSDLSEYVRGTNPTTTNLIDATTNPTPGDQRLVTIKLASLSGGNTLVASVERVTRGSYRDSSRAAIPGMTLSAAPGGGTKTLTVVLHRDADYCVSLGAGGGSPNYYFFDVADATEGGRVIDRYAMMGTELADANTLNGTEFVSLPALRGSFIRVRSSGASVAGVEGAPMVITVPEERDYTRPLLLRMNPFGSPGRTIVLSGRPDRMGSLEVTTQDEIGEDPGCRGPVVPRGVEPPLIALPGPTGGGGGGPSIPGYDDDGPEPVNEDYQATVTDGAGGVVYVGTVASGEGSCESCCGSDAGMTVNPGAGMNGGSMGGGSGGLNGGSGAGQTGLNFAFGTGEFGQGGGGSYIGMPSQTLGPDWLRAGNLQINSPSAATGFEILNLTPAHRQAVAANQMVDITEDAVNHTLTLRYIDREQFTGNFGSARAFAQGSEFKTIQLSNYRIQTGYSVDGRFGNYRRIHLSSVSSSVSEVYEISWLSRLEMVAGALSLVETWETILDLGGGKTLRTVLTKTTPYATGGTNATRTEVRKVYGPDGIAAGTSLLSHTVTTYTIFKWGERVVAQKRYRNATEFESYTWDWFDNGDVDAQNSPVPVAAIGRISHFGHPGGMASNFQFDGNGQQSFMEQINPGGGGGSSSRTVVQEGPIGNGDWHIVEILDDGTASGEMSCVMEKCTIGPVGYENKLKTIITKIVTGPECDPEDESNLVDSKFRWHDASNPQAGCRIVGKTGADGISTSTDYNVLPNGNLEVVRKTGAGTWNGVTDGMRVRWEVDPTGVVLSREERDIVSNVITDLRMVTLRDSRGRPTLITYLDGTATEADYDCCNGLFEIDRNGVETNYTSRDIHGNVLAVFNDLDGVTTRYERDGLGRVVSTFRSGYGFAEHRTDRLQRAMLGRVTSSTDVNGAVTDFAESNVTFEGKPMRQSLVTLPSVANPLNPQATLRPQTRTIRHPDGRLHSTAERIDSNTLVETARYEYTTNAASKIYTEKEIRRGSGVLSPDVVVRRNYLMGRLVSTENNGAVTTYGYDTAGRLARETDPDGILTLTTYDNRGRVYYEVVDTDRSGTDSGNSSYDRHVYHGYAYSAKSHATLGSVPVSRHWTMAYVKTTTASMIELEEASADGLHSWITDSSWAVTETISTGPPSARIVTVTRPDQTKSVTTHDRGRVASFAEKASSGTGLVSTQLFYDGLGRVEKQVHSRNGQTSLAYNPDDTVATRTEQDPNSTYNGTPGPNPLITAFAYDALQRATAVTLPDNTVQTTTYYLNGTTRFQNGSQTYPVRYAYDPQGRMVTMTTIRDTANTATEATTAWAYDDRGRLRYKIHDWDGATAPASAPNRTSYTYTDAGRLSSRLWARGVSTDYYYHPGSGLLTYVDYSDTTPDIAYHYDRIGRLERVDEGALNSPPGEHAYSRGQAFFFNMAPKIRYLGEANYDSDLPVWISYSGLASLSPQYSGAVTFDDTSNPPNEYLLLTGLPSGSLIGYVEIEQVDFTVSPRSNVFKYGVNVGATTDDFLLSTEEIRGLPLADNSNPVVTIHRRYGDGTTVPGRYRGFYVDRLGQALTDYDIAYGFDGTGQLSTVSTAHTRNLYGVLQPYQFTYQRTLAGDKTVVNGMTSPVGSTSKHFQPSRYTETQIINNDLVGYLSEHFYNYNALGQRTQHTVGVYIGTPTSYRSKTYAYNARGEVTGEEVSANADKNRAYEYDAIGNRKRRNKGQPGGLSAPFTGGALTTYTADDLNRYSTIAVATPAATFTPTHDSDGNLTDDDQFVYEWDGENRLVALTPKVEADYVRRFAFGYDYLGRRIKRVTAVYFDGLWYAERDNNFVYDGWNPVVDYHFEWGNVGPLFIDRFAWGLDLSGSLQGAGGVGGLLSVNHNDELTAYNQYVNEWFYTYDANGNVSELVDINGSVAAHYEYDAFGNETVNTAATGNPIVADWNPFRFSTKWSERTMYYYGGSPQSTTAPDRAFSYYGYRFYDPEHGRWLSRDPIGELGGLNLFGHSNNSLNNFTDPLGLDPWHH